MKVIIDPGHGGHDPGAVGKVAKEKDIVLNIGNKIAREDRLDCLLTRTEDIFVSLKDRVDIANANDCDLFVSMHCNASTSQEPRDLQIYYKTDCAKSHIGAQTVFKHVSGIDADISRWSRIIPCDTFYVLKRTLAPAILIELDFISNPKREQWLMDDDIQELFVKKIVKGINEYFGVTA
jgi:N-acetylmuramoyl-L-alanine amidase